MKKRLSIDTVSRMIFERGFSVSSNAIFESAELERIVLRLEEIQKEQKKLWEQLAKLKHD